MNLVLAGGSGFLGQALKHHFESIGWTVVTLSRRPGPGIVEWDGQNVGAWKESLEGADALINLSGVPVTRKWDESGMREIVNSRVESTRAIRKGIEACQSPPRVWINASAVGIYGDRGDEILDESSPLGNEDEFMVRCCKAWEAEVDAGAHSVRKVKLRIGVVLGHEGGAYPILSKLTKAFIGGHVGSGSQYMSWIHLTDLVRMFEWSVNSTVNGVVNGTAPEPVKNADFMATLRRSLGRPWSPPAPRFALRLMTALGGPESQPVLQGQRVLPRVALDAGFEFSHASLEAALNALRESK